MAVSHYSCDSRYRVYRAVLDVRALVCETTEKVALAELDVAFLRTVGLSLVRV
jgi:hypothetical protein